MAQEKRTPVREGDGKLPAGLLLAKVVGYLDPAFMCGLEVTLLRENGNSIGDLNQTYSVKYASPFYGVTAYEYMGMNKGDFQDTQKSYGMWFPTVEIGTTVLVAFVDGSTDAGYFIACVPDRFMNHMVPAVAGSSEFEATQDQKRKYDTTQPLPVGEFNRKANSQEKSLAIEKIKKPIHPIADRFLKQGLLEDDVRGVSTSTSRRDVPNAVFGISTPGPLDRSDGAKKQFIGKQQSKSPIPMPVGRLGGTTFVMDDGEDRYQRKKHASEGGQEYADTEAGEKGDPDIPYSEYFRIRTRTGHQILMHNSEDLIYIGNSSGTSWVELTSNGKIDIYAEDCISIHSEKDINLRADRDVNIEGGRNVNIKAAADYSKDADSDDKGFPSGRVFIESKHDTKVVVGANGYITTTQNLNVGTGVANYFSAGGNTNILSGGVHYETAATIHMNGPAATPATPATSLSLHENVRTSSQEKWEEKNRYAVKESLKSIIRRIPMHEPWALHENFAPEFLTPDNTDREAE